MQSTRIGLSLALILLLSGCIAHIPEPDTEPGKPEWAPPEIDYSLPDAENGSAYRPGFMLTLFKDKRAFREGDILTVALDEETYSSKRADTKTNKVSGMSIDGQGSTDGSSVSGSGEANMGRSFNGTGSSTQQNQLSGSITVTVAKVLPNGALLIRGEKWLRLNQGDEYLRLLGLIRTDDIGNDNTISSQRIADARIIYGGQGAISDSNRMGWAARYFNSPWFPL
ncbi:flagellar basal body L-ring protein FlgH [Shewanella sp. Choline-02u-19]|jgi:flagellar L-ring protein precursor FlgH|uniref:flagellar basal body L-ring protein FlgH n=1 Tax=unclassified Shewanella TaxID=196818 RepID=UPI000C31D37B|nr:MULTISPECIES: flagellar basal body L-ring protein FlgH [unclassified Shewanella]PKG56097.1 flagellar basal body L-ring protein FlgH [Shewanella sp. GutDb-MelDb]PKH57269.1 flagellar basal body L-ring protein FlgH [Shewanella sp. Bg11-22]PKI29617.1 flagellar basal body L-ring protein FlgH [Shewanella sp. Choline-02u-19]